MKGSRPPHSVLNAARGFGEAVCSAPPTGCERNLKNGILWIIVVDYIFDWIFIGYIFVLLFVLLIYWNLNVVFIKCKSDTVLFATHFVIILIWNSSVIYFNISYEYILWQVLILFGLVDLLRNLLWKIVSENELGKKLLVWIGMELFKGLLQRLFKPNRISVPNQAKKSYWLPEKIRLSKAESLIKESHINWNFQLV